MTKLYVTSDNKHSAILFSQDMMKKHSKMFPNAEYRVVDTMEDAFSLAIPQGYTSKKAFAVRNGHIKGICFTSDEYETFMRKYKNSCGKKCSDVYDAYRFIYGKKIPANLTNAHYFDGKPYSNIVYVDGSFHPSNNMMGLAYEIHSSGKTYSHSSFIKTSKNGSSCKAELLSAMMAVERAIGEGLTELTIVHDNEMICSMAKKNKSKDKFNQAYFSYIQNAAHHIHLSFQKVKGHSGDTHNDRVDKMARHKNIDRFVSML